MLVDMAGGENSGQEEKCQAVSHEAWANGGAGWPWGSGPIRGQEASDPSSGTARGAPQVGGHAVRSVATQNCAARWTWAGAPASYPPARRGPSLGAALERLSTSVDEDT